MYEVKPGSQICGLELPIAKKIIYLPVKDSKKVLQQFLRAKGVIPRANQRVNNYLIRVFAVECTRSHILPIHKCKTERYKHIQLTLKGPLDRYRLTSSIFFYIPCDFYTHFKQSRKGALNQGNNEVLKSLKLGIQYHCSFYNISFELC